MRCGGTKPWPTLPSAPHVCTCTLGCRDLGAPLPVSDAVYFPYAVVEIKLQEAPPEWVQGLLSTGEQLL